jgi:hypothetical protein
LVTVLALSVAVTLAWSQAIAGDPTGKVLFAIGQVDKSNSEFKEFGFKGIHDYQCAAGTDCVAEPFPARSYRMSAADLWDRNGVAQITINFMLDQAYDNLVLRIARAGAETTVVTVDEKQNHRVTNTMLKSNEDGVYGAYDVELGALNKGAHTIQFTVEEDGKGSGRHSWDAIVLVAE